MDFGIHFFLISISAANIFLIRLPSSFKDIETSQLHLYLRLIMLEIY